MYVYMVHGDICIYIWCMVAYVCMVHGDIYSIYNNIVVMFYPIGPAIY